MRSIYRELIKIFDSRKSVCHRTAGRPEVDSGYELRSLSEAGCTPMNFMSLESTIWIVGN